MIHRLRTVALATALTAILAVPAAVEAQVALANVRVHATIESVDRDNRMFTLRGPQGNLFERTVPEDMPGFGARRPGDEVTIMFLYEVGLHLRKPGAPLPNLSEIDAPPGVTLIVHTVATEVSQVDASEQAVSLRSLSGPGMEATFRLPAGFSLSDFAEGDVVDVTYVVPEVVSLEAR
jgi:hypothetical protein